MCGFSGRPASGFWKTAEAHRDASASKWGLGFCRQHRAEQLNHWFGRLQRSEVSDDYVGLSVKAFPIGRSWGIDKKIKQGSIKNDYGSKNYYSEPSTLNPKTFRTLTQKPLSPKLVRPFVGEAGTISRHRISGDLPSLTKQIEPGTTPDGPLLATG